MIYSGHGESYPNQANGQHKCEYCGTLYDEQWGYLPKPASDKAFCRCCKKVLGEWDSIDYPIFKLVEEYSDERDDMTEGRSS
jgi:hypothetical protein